MNGWSFQRLDEHVQIHPIFNQMRLVLGLLGSPTKCFVNSSSSWKDIVVHQVLRQSNCGSSGTHYLDESQCGQRWTQFPHEWGFDTPKLLVVLRSHHIANVEPGQMGNQQVHQKFRTLVPHPFRSRNPTGCEVHLGKGPLLPHMLWGQVGWFSTSQEAFQSGFRSPVQAGNEPGLLLAVDNAFRQFTQLDWQFWHWIKSKLFWETTLRSFSLNSIESSQKYFARSSSLHDFPPSLHLKWNWHGVSRVRLGTWLVTHQRNSKINHACLTMLYVLL